MAKVDRFSRSRSLFGDDFKKIKNANVLVCGVGGVGGVCVDALMRAGIGNLTIIDFDKFEVTNQNRQIYSNFLDYPKVAVFKQIYPQIHAIKAKITPEFVENFDFSEFDVVIDAIDDIQAKIALAFKTHEKLVSSAGAARRIDASKIKVASVWQTSGDPFARKIRNELKKAKFDGDFEMVYSDEAPMCQDLGSFMGVTASFGLFLASLAVQRVLKTRNF